MQMLSQKQQDFHQIYKKFTKLLSSNALWTVKSNLNLCPSKNLKNRKREKMRYENAMEIQHFKNWGEVTEAKP